ncbi:hypothetical protein HN031_15545 [Nocardioides sp. zg-1308]|uniref:hypothetical protein n=1 Tax=Nocardioides sp. zg-1308 TaxID=2736253 RepID=UPI001553122E|nr:hypothetical protein [Nocardioides sp. zg-1308]NPD06093.1 hypothetical protein [Nocardioides sp. zg-1308]
MSWLILCGASPRVMATAFFVALRTSDATSAGMTVLFGVILVGIAAALFSAILSPLPDSTGPGQGMGNEFASRGPDAGGGGDCGG